MARLSRSVAQLAFCQPHCASPNYASGASRLLLGLLAAGQLLFWAKLEGGNWPNWPDWPDWTYAVGRQPTAIGRSDEEPTAIGQGRGHWTNLAAIGHDPRPLDVKVIHWLRSRDVGQRLGSPLASGDGPERVDSMEAANAALPPAQDLGADEPELPIRGLPPFCRHRSLRMRRASPDFCSSGFIRRDRKDMGQHITSVRSPYG